jgi:hypothetical protein
VRAMTRFLFGPQGQLLARLARGPVRELPPPTPVPPSEVSDEELFAAVLEVTRDGGVATEAERGGRFFGVSRQSSDGQFDFQEHHFMQPCRCRVIDCKIVTFCPAHAAYYARVATNFGRPEGWEDMARRWDGIIDEETTR